MLPSTFQLARGLGPGRERLLWSMGMAHWRDVEFHPRPLLTPAFDLKLRSAIDNAAAASSRGDALALASMLPPMERWRLLPDFGERALFLDIETGADDHAFEGISAIGMLDRDGPRLLLAGRDLAMFPEFACHHPMLVTFNGLSFDVPVLRKAFPGWRPPPIHMDLRHVLARAGHHGGLKRIEVELGMRRPDHLAGIDGFAAVWLWRRGLAGDRAALRLFAEYNLYDVVSLPSLAALAYNALVDAVDAPGVREATARMPVPGRGDVLYDVSKILLRL